MKTVRNGYCCITKWQCGNLATFRHPKFVFLSLRCQESAEISLLFDLQNSYSWVYAARKVRKFGYLSTSKIRIPASTLAGKYGNLATCRPPKFVFLSLRYQESDEIWLLFDLQKSYSWIYAAMKVRKFGYFSTSKIRIPESTLPGKCGNLATSRPPKVVFLSLRCQESAETWVLVDLQNSYSWVYAARKVRRLEILNATCMVLRWA